MVSSGIVVWEIQAGKGRASFPVTFLMFFLFWAAVRRRVGNDDVGDGVLTFFYQRRGFGQVSFELGRRSVYLSLKSPCWVASRQERVLP